MNMKLRSSRNPWGTILLLTSGLLSCGLQAQNLVGNGSFEVFSGRLPPAPWTGSFGMALGFDGAADGRNFAGLDQTSSFAAQTLATIPQQSYHISFALSGNSSVPGLSTVEVSWGGSVIG